MNIIRRLTAGLLALLIFAAPLLAPVLAVLAIATPAMATPAAGFVNVSVDIQEPDGTYDTGTGYLYANIYKAITLSSGAIITPKKYTFTIVATTGTTASGYITLPETDTATPNNVPILMIYQDSSGKQTTLGNIIPPTTSTMPTLAALVLAGGTPYVVQQQPVNIDLGGIAYVRSLTTLANTVGALDQTRVLVTGYGIYRWDINSSATPDQLTVVTTAAATGRWILEIGGQSTGGIVDTATLTTLAAYPGTNGQRVLVKDAGFYRLDSSSSVTANGVGVVTATGGGRWILEVDGDLFRPVIYASQYGVKADGSTDDLAAAQAAILATPAQGTLVFPPGPMMLSAALGIKKDITYRGAGGNFVTVWKPINNTSLITLNAGDGSTTRARFKGITFEGRNSSDSAPLMDLSEWFICDFEDCMLYQCNKGIRIYGSGSGDSTSAISFHNCIVQRCATYALSLEGQYSAHFEQCDIERNYAGTGAGSNIITSNSAGRSFNKCGFDNCHFEYVPMSVNSEGFSLTNCQLISSSVALGEYSNNCQVLGNSLVNSSCLDTGWHNKIQGTFTNSREQGVDPWNWLSNIILDTYYRGATGDEYVYMSAAWPNPTTITGGTITYANTSATTIFQTAAFTLAADNADTFVTTHIPKKTFTNLECVRIGSDNGVAITGASEVKAKRNLIANGTFYQNLATSWSAGGAGTASIGSSLTAGYSLLTGTGGAWGYYQQAPTIPGHRYMLIAKTVEGTGFTLTQGDVWNGGAQYADATNYLLSDGSYLNQSVFEAVGYNQRISIGSTVAATVDVAWVALVDLDDRDMYAYQSPATGQFQHGQKFWNINPTAGAPLGWDCAIDGAPGTWKEMAPVSQ